MRTPLIYPHGMPQTHSTPSLNNLPDELLNYILRCLGNSFLISPREDSPKPLWKACSLVCKRWYAIAIPLLFRYTFLDGDRPRPAIESLAPTSPCVQFFVDRPQIASRVEILGLDNIEMEDMSGLDRLLGCLPSLKTLRLADVITRSDMNSSNEVEEGPGEEEEETKFENPIRMWASHTVDQLVYLGQRHEPFIQCANFVRALALFAEIGELSIKVVDTAEAEGEWPTEELVDMSVKHTLDIQQEMQTSGGSAVVPRIKKLRCWGESVGGFFIPMYLLRLGALRDLTQLTFTLTYDMEWEWFFDIVFATRSTLTSLNIEISAFTANGMYTIFDSVNYQ